MKVSYVFSKIFLSVLILPAFVLASEPGLEDNDVILAAERRGGCEDRDWNDVGDDKKDNAVFASFRNNRDQVVLGEETVKFNITNANKGCGICYDFESGEFLIKKSGFYLVICGTASIGTAGQAGDAFPFNLIKTKSCGWERERTTLATFLTDSSSGVVVFLKKGDKVAIISLDTVRLIAGSLPPRTTSLTDTAFISFLKLDCCF